MSGDVSYDNQQWFLKINDKTFGPYATEQILSLLNHREIQPEDQLTNTRLSGRWITVQEFAVLNVNHHLPPRPAEIENQKTGLIQRPPSKPMDDLFEILQVAKERQANSSPSPSFTPAPVSPDTQPLPPLFTLIAGVGALCLLGGIGYGWVHLNSAPTPVPDIVERQRTDLSPPAPPAPTAIAAKIAPAIRPVARATRPTAASFFPRAATNRLGGISLAHPIIPARSAIARHGRPDRDSDTDRDSQDRDPEDGYGQSSRDRDRQAVNPQEDRDSGDPEYDRRDSRNLDDARAPASGGGPGDRQAQQGAGGGPDGYAQDGSPGSQAGYSGSEDPSGRSAPQEDMTVHSANADDDEAARMGAAGFSPDHNH